MRTYSSANAIFANNRHLAFARLASTVSPRRPSDSAWRQDGAGIEHQSHIVGDIRSREYDSPKIV